MLVGIASELQIRPKCKCNFEGENVNRVAGGEGGCRDSRKIKINKKLASSEISISCPRKNYNRQGKWRVISSPFSNDRDVIVEVRRLRYARVCVRECMCRNICTYNWNGLLLKNNKKKKKRGHVEAIHRWPRIDLKIQSNLKLFETRFLIHGYVTYIRSQTL